MTKHYRMPLGGVTLFLLGVGPLMALGAIGLAVTDHVLERSFESDIGHHVQEAFNTVSAPASSAELEIALDAIHAHGLDSGYTNLIWHSKCGDMAYWTRTLTEAKADVDRASYERTVWNPEANENTILARHYRVLHENYGDSMSPCYIHWLDAKAMPLVIEIQGWMTIPAVLATVIFVGSRLFWFSENGLPATRTSDGRMINLDDTFGAFRCFIGPVRLKRFAKNTTLQITKAGIAANEAAAVKAAAEKLAREEAQAAKLAAWTAAEALSAKETRRKVRPYSEWHNSYPHDPSW